MSHKRYTLTAAAGATRLGPVAQEWRAALDQLRQQVREDIHASAAETRRHAEVLAEETRRHFDVAAEHLESKLQLVAEGVIALDQKGERFRDETREEFRRIDHRLLRLEARVSALERH